MFFLLSFYESCFISYLLRIRKRLNVRIFAFIRLKIVLKFDIGKETFNLSLRNLRYKEMVGGDFHTAIPGRD